MRRPKRSASPGQALQDVTARLQEIRLGNSQSLSDSRGKVIEELNLGSAGRSGSTEVTMRELVADTATIRKEDSSAEPVVAAHRQTPTAIAADMQDIDKRLATLQQFLQQTKTPG